MECCRRRELGLGSLALVPLAEAWEKASANRKLARQGGDPLAEKRRTQGIPTFAEATACVLQQKRAGWRMRQRLRAVLEWAVAMEYRTDNPCDRIGPALVTQHDVVEHMQALPHREVPAAIRTVQASTALPAVRLAFEFLVLTAARWGEVRWAEWAEIDRDGCVWTVPARRAKTNPRHWVPLCGCALEILEAAQALEAGTGPLVFTHGGGRPLHDSQVLRLLRQFGIAAVPHGFRSSFRGWAAEETDHLSGMIRLQPFGNTGHGLVPRRRGDESEQETGSPNDRGMIDSFRLWGSRRWRRINAPLKKT